MVEKQEIIERHLKQESGCRHFFLKLTLFKGVVFTNVRDKYKINLNFNK